MTFDDASRALRSGDLFYSPAWFDNLQRHGFVQLPVRHRVAEETVEGEVQLLLMRSEAGAHLAAQSNYYSCLYGPTGPSHALSDSGWHALVTKARALPGSAVIQLQPLDAADAWVASLEQALREHAYVTFRYFCFGNWYQPVASGGFAAYWTDRPSALRHSVERGRRRLDKAGPWRIDIATCESDDLEAAINAYESVYARSWKQPEPCPGFMPGLIRTAAREGWLRLGVLRLNGEALAAQLWLVHAGKANIYKLAYVEGVEKLSAGSVLTATLMEHVMDIDRVNEVDYLSGDDAYKADWMALRRERVGLLACDLWRWPGWMAAARHTLGRWSRRLKTWLPGA